MLICPLDDALLPVEMSADPDDKEDLGVERRREPESLDSLEPVDTITSPPAPDAPAPADTDTSLPLPDADAPTCSVKLPPAPRDDEPVLSTMEPPSPADAAPVLIDTEPLDVAASPVDNDAPPLRPASELDDESDSAPLSESALEPVLSVTLPPGA